MVVASHTLAPPLAAALDGHAVNQAEARALFNPDPEVNSLAERIVHLQALGVPPQIVRELLADVREILRLNAVEDHCHHTVAGLLDDLTRALRDHELNGHVRRELTVKEIARRARPALAVIARPAGHGAAEFVAAVRAIDDLVGALPAAQLLAPSVRHEIGAGRFRLLEQLHASRTAVSA